MKNNCCSTNISCGCNTNDSYKTLVISWQRLVSDGDTCPRCGSTEEELEKAVAQLKGKLGPKGISVILEKKEMTKEEFQQNPLGSNKILFNNVSLEDLLDAKAGHSKCCDVCGGEECRTIETEGKNYETIPAELI